MAGKQAVVLIHGIGEQRPMRNLRAFVDAVWTTHAGVHAEHKPADGQVLWSKPDFVSDNFELRRLTTIRNSAGVRTDFFEFYWAHMMPGNTWRHVTAWARLLLLRNPADIPRQVRGLWLLLVVLTALPFVCGVIGLFAGGPEWLANWIEPIAGGATGFVLGALPGILAGAVSSRFVVDRVGDAARYLDAAPPNIERRHKIRTAGVELLQALHNRTRSNGGAEYERIVLVGHSLGSVIGYDILAHAWARFHRYPQNQHDTDALDDLDHLSWTEPGSDAFRAAQAAYREELNDQDVDWRVSDFVTLGSPLTYAPLLLALGREDFQRRKDDRELPTCPPVGEPISGGEGVSLAYRRRRTRVPNHAAVFGPTRWTNLFFAPKFALWGDLISGPIAPVLGRGIRDVPVRTRLRWGFLSHTLYWRREGRAEGVEPHIAALREALSLVERTDSDDEPDEPGAGREHVHATDDPPEVGGGVGVS